MDADKAFCNRWDCSMRRRSVVGLTFRLSPGGENGVLRMFTSSVALSGSSSLLLPTSHGPLTTHRTCVNPMLTSELPEHALVGNALPQAVVDGNAPRWHDMWRISLGRRPSDRRWMSERMSVLRVDAIILLCAPC